MAKDAFYFSHDSNARNDLKIKAMRKKYGWQGYGWFWMIVELLRDQDDYRLPYDDLTIEGIADEMQVDSNMAREFVNYCINICKLFELNGEYFYSPSLNRRMNHYDEIKEKRSEAGKIGAQARWNNSKRIANASDCHAIDVAKNSKEKKEKKINKEKERYLEYVLLSTEEYQKLLEKTDKATIDEYIQRLNNYIGSTGKRYKSHYHTILNWLNRDNKGTTASSDNALKEDAEFCESEFRKFNDPCNLETGVRQYEYCRVCVRFANARRTDMPQRPHEQRY